MPIYNFRNKETGEIYEEMMSISDSEELLKRNPNIEKFHGKINFIDEVMLGRKKPPSDWFHVLDRIKKNNPGNTMDSTTRFSKPKEW